MKSKITSFALVDLLVTAAVAVVLLSLGIPAVSRVHELSKRSVCALNLAGIGAAAKIYATSNKDQWMVPPFKQGAIDNLGIDYLAGNRVNEPPVEPGEVGNLRLYQTTSETPNSNTGSTAMSVTRAYWMLVRSGDVSVKQFICPSNLDDVPDHTEQIDLYYDFTGYRNISYGYQVPFGPRDTQPREGADVHKILAADKGPFYLASSGSYFDYAGEDGGPIQLDDPPKNWRRFNSLNHGGAFGEGQNVLYSDGQVSFVRIPAVGVDNDNIYTLMLNDWTTIYGRIHGDTPHESAAFNPYPGQNAFGPGGGRYSSTDSLIYP